MNWTPEQIQAITIRNKSVIVSASAGSGKTAVLVSRLLEILSDMEHPVKADAIIVVTFTNDAAAEMKQRLAKAISDKLDYMSRNGQQQAELYDWLLQQRSLLGNARISTIHAFCFDLIRENAEECGISSQFRIAESAQEAVYRRRALQSVLERFSKKHKEESELLFSRFCARDDKKIEDIILCIDKHLNSIAFPDYWLSEAERICQREKGVLLGHIRSLFCAGIEDAISFAQYSRGIARQAAVAADGSCPYEEKVLNPEIAMMQEHIQYIRSAPDDILLQEPEAHVVNFVSMGSVKTAKCKKEDASKKLFTKLHDFYKSIYQNYACCSSSSAISIPDMLRFYQEDETMQKQVLPLLLLLTRQYREALFQEKQSQNVLSFDDAEYLVLTKLLGQIDEHGTIHKTPLAETLSEQYQFIMVDEYQDSNNRQDWLFKLLAHHSQHDYDTDSRNRTGNNTGDSHCQYQGQSQANQQELDYGDNVFLVGDVKQSIYTFRKASPENFMRAIEKSLTTEEMATIYLNRNFRSSPGVIAFVNALFACVMTKQCGEVDYQENEKLHFGATIYENLDMQYQRTQILFPKKQNDTQKSSFALQAQCIAAKIADMIAKRYPVMTADGVRPCEYRDFCVLMRTKGNHGVMAEAFRQEGVPCICQDSTGFLTLPEIHLIWNLLKAADNPMTDIAMTSVLLSPLYSFTTAELAILKLLATDKNRLYLQIRYLAGQHIPEYTALSEKCRLFLEQFEKIREAADRFPLEICIQKIYDITDLLSLQSVYENADQRRENLEIFAEYAREYREHADLTAQSCMSGFLRYLAYVQESDENADFVPKTAAYINTDAVSVKTIHKSKGLEYPFVFIADLNRSFGKSNPKHPTVVLTSESGLIGLKMIDKKRYLKIKTTAFSYLDVIRSMKEKHEEMRLLYVAATRAKQQLFLLMDERHFKKTQLKLMEMVENCPDILQGLAKEAKNMQNWIVWFLLSSGEAEFVKKAISGETCHSALADYIVWKPCTQENPEADRGEQAEKNGQPTDRICYEPDRIADKTPDEQIVSRIQKQLAYQYNSIQATLPAKYSVTELSHEMQEISIREPKFLSETQDGKLHQLRGKLRGTAIHKMMQFMEFKQAKENLTSELERLQKTGYLTASEAKALEQEKLEAFFNSHLYQRIAASDKIERERQLFVKISELHLPETSVFAQNYSGTDGIIIGTVDLLFHEADGWVIVDYKSDKSQPESELLEKYKKQLGLYQKAMELVLGEPVKQAYIYYFTRNSTIEVDLADIIY